MLKIVMMKGLPGSGKSTYAKELVGKGFVRINKDDLRAMLHNVPEKKFNPKNEAFILKSRDWLIRASLSDGKSVVVDDTNFEPKHAQSLLETAKNHNASFEVKFIDTPLEECIKRDLKRPNSVGETVVRRMYNKYIRVIDEYDTENLAGLPTATIFDIDGTLAHMTGRGPYEWKRVGEDSTDSNVIGMLAAISYAALAVGADHKIILVSGRDGSCRPETEEWLKTNQIPYDLLYMRPEGDNRKDTLIKEEIFENYIKDKFWVNVVFDDRDQVVEMWRNKGLKVFQVAEGDF